MSVPRIVTLVLAIATPIIAFRLGGTNLWFMYALGTSIAAALALYVLWQDGMLADLAKPRGLDISSGFAVAAGLYVVIVLAWNFLIAPANEAAGLLQRCTMQGTLVPRQDAHGARALFEFVRTQTCKGYAASLAITGPTRGVAIVIIAALEEIAWRGGVQQTLSEKLGSTRGWIAASLLFAAANAATGNVLVGLLALVSGLAWGALYRFRKRLAPSVFSHAVFSYFLFHAQPLVKFVATAGG